MQDYLVLEQESVSCSSFSSEEYPGLYIKSLKEYKQCRATYNVDKLAFGNVQCTNDEQCRFGGVKNRCNTITGRCALSQEAEQKAFNCFLDSLTEYQEFYLKEKFVLSGRKDDQQYRDGLRDALTFNDCLNTDGTSSVTHPSLITQTG